MPGDARDDALRYYEEYFDGAGPERGSEVVAALESPDQAASAILADLAVKQMEASPKSTGKWLKSLGWLLSAILCAPLALPLAIAAVCVVLVLFVVLLVLFVAVYLADFSLLLLGLLSALCGFGLLGQSAASSLLFIGLGLLLAGGSVALLIPLLWLTKKSASGMIHGIHHKLVRRNHNEKEN